VTRAAAPRSSAGAHSAWGWLAPRHLAWALPAALLVATCGVLGLIEPTETRYAEIAREMAASGDWLTPRLNGIAHFHKPPLAYWATAGGLRVLGVNEWGARLGLALAAGFLLWCAARLARRVGVDFVLAPLVLASSALFFALSHQLASDVFLAAAVGAFWVAYLDPARRDGPLPMVALAAGFMAKGPIVLVHTLVPACLAALWVRDAQPLRTFGRARSLLVFAALALPWYLIEAVRTPGLAGYWLGVQLWGRYATTMQHRAGPWYYFVPVVVGGALPWIAAAAAGTWRGAARVWLQRGEREVKLVHGRGPAREAVSFERAAVLAWAWTPILFFSTAGSKLPAYVLPEFPAIALAATAALGPDAGGRGRRVVAIVTGTLLIAIAAEIELAGPAGLAHLVGARNAATLPLPAPAHVAAVAFALGGIACVALRPVAGAALALIAWTALLPAAHSIEGLLGSPRPLARLLLAARVEGDPVVEYRTFNAGLPFYLRERVPMLEVPRELQFETPESRTRSVLEYRDRVRIALGHDRIWVLARHGQGDALAASLGRRTVDVARWLRDDLIVLVPPVSLPTREREVSP
jgi:4-amino-4-deoxy-L-arabinose transferase-like glycosyltransferase